MQGDTGGIITIKRAEVEDLRAQIEERQAVVEKLIEDNKNIRREYADVCERVSELIAAIEKDFGVGQKVNELIELLE